MAVTKQNYTVSAPWTSSELADAFRDAFIDAGLMTSWHDSFTSEITTNSIVETLQHRVLRIVMVPGKQYGTIYHWFVFRASGQTEYSMAHQWDVVNHQPTGVIGLDYVNLSYTVAPNQASQFTSHRVFGTHVTSTTTTLTRYTSGVRSGFSMFLLKGGNNYFSFFFIPPGASPQPFIDLNLNTCGGLMTPSMRRNDSNTNAISNYRSVVAFAHRCSFYNNIFNYGASGEQGAFSIDRYSYQMLQSAVTGIAYSAWGDRENNSANNINIGSENHPGRTLSQTIRDKFDDNDSSVPSSLYISLPAERSGMNRNRSSDSTPVFSDLPYSMYFLDRMPIDFGIAWHWTNSTMEVQDVFQVTPGLEEWEIIAHSNVGASAHPSALVLARII